MPKVTIQQLNEMKQNGEKISYVTAYDFGQATLVEKAGIEMILVGDSMSMTMNLQLYFGDNSHAFDTLTCMRSNNGS